MKLSDLIAISDSYTDEVLSTTSALLYANEVVAKINTKFRIILPYFTDATTAYTALDEGWLRRLFVPWLNYSVKMNDSSLNEAQRWQMEFMEALAEFAGEYLDILDEQYLTGDMVGVYQMDTSGAIPTGWFNGKGSRGL
jgi:hypothetical protein